MALTKVIGDGLGAVTQDGAATFNEGSADVDFRVESNDSANMLFINGGNNKVGIGVDAAATVFHVETSTDGTGVSGDDIYIAKFYNREATDSRSYGVDIHAGSNSTDQALRCKTHDGGTQLFLVKGDGSATIANGLTLTDGNLVVASGHGIDFSANSNAGGMTSELLDSYEEGTWTMTDQSGASLSLTVYVSSYTKIGNQVFFEFGMVFPTTSDTNDIRLSLPFTAKATNDNTGGGGITVTNSGRTDTLVVIRNTSTFAVQSLLNASATNANYSGKQLRVAGQYTV
jgi:hypothetical protein